MPKASAKQTRQTGSPSIGGHRDHPEKMGDPGANQPGSPIRLTDSPHAPAYLAVGLVRRPHGLHGDVLMEVYTDFPERLLPGTTVYIGRNHEPHTIVRRREHNDGLLLGFKNFDTPEAAGRLRNAVAYVPAADRPPLPEGSYYHHQLLGFQVVDESGGPLGILAEILITGANDVYVIKDGGGSEILVPVIAGVVLDVDVSAGRIRVHLPPGLVEGASQG